MRRNCDVCLVEYEAQRKTSKFCSDRCRDRNRRITSGGKSSARFGVELVADATKRELTRLGRLSTPEGVNVMALARRLDSESAVDTAAGMAALSREWRTALAEATMGASEPTSKADAVEDELAARRAKRRPA